jgi:hypothetical protein
MRTAVAFLLWRMSAAPTPLHPHNLPVFSPLTSEWKHRERVMGRRQLRGNNSPENVRGKVGRRVSREALSALKKGNDSFGEEAVTVYFILKISI